MENPDGLAYDEADARLSELPAVTSLATRARNLAETPQCEYRPVTGHYKNDSLYGERCTKTKTLQVHHLHYDGLGAERSEDLEVLCGFLHVVRETERLSCENDGEPIYDEEEALHFVQQVAKETGVRAPTLKDIKARAETYCGGCQHMWESAMR